MPRKPKDQKICEHFVWVLFRRGDTWYADGRSNIPDLGKHTLGVTDKGDAIEALRELDRRMAAKLKLIDLLPEDNHKEIPVTEAWENYLSFIGRSQALGGASEKTKKRYRAVRDKHVLFCAQHGIATWNRIGRKEVSAYGEHLKKLGKSDATVYLECTLLKQVVKWLIEEEGALPESHRIRLRLIRSHESDTYCFSREEVKAMIDLCRNNPKLKWLAEILTALATTGMRIEELCCLRWSDVDLTANTITLADNRHSGLRQKVGAVRTTKGRRTRRVPIHPEFRAVLERMPRRSDGRVFGGPCGGIAKQDTIRVIFKREVIGPLTEKFATPRGEIGFEHARLHSFRHFFVSQAFLGGASEGEIRDWVGHRDSRIIERYRHLRNAEARRKMDRIDFLGGEPKDDGGANHGVANPKKNDNCGDGREGAEQNRGADGPDGPDRR
jgi:integrase